MLSCNYRCNKSCGESRLSSSNWKLWGLMIIWIETGFNGCPKFRIEIHSRVSRPSSTIKIRQDSSTFSRIILAFRYDVKMERFILEISSPPRFWWRQFKCKLWRWHDISFVFFCNKLILLGEKSSIAIETRRKLLA